MTYQQVNRCIWSSRRNPECLYLICLELFQKYQSSGDSSSASWPNACASEYLLIPFWSGQHMRTVSIKKHAVRSVDNYYNKSKWISAPLPPVRKLSLTYTDIFLIPAKIENVQSATLPLYTSGIPSGIRKGQVWRLCILGTFLDADHLQCSRSKESCEMALNTTKTTVRSHHEDLTRRLELLSCFEFCNESSHPGEHISSHVHSVIPYHSNFEHT